MAGEDHAAGFVIYAEGSDVVATLVAGVKELPLESKLKLPESLL